MSNFLINSPRCVFIHIPKTGGTSIRNGFFCKNYEGPVFGHLPKEWRSEFSFAFVRNPYDRLISALKIFTLGTDQLKENFPPLTLREFLEIVTDNSIIYDERRSSYEERIRHHTIPQTHPFNCLHLAKYVGRLENIKEDFKNVCAKIGCEYSPLPQIHSTKRLDYKHYFDDETFEIATKYYETDLKKLCYTY